MEGPDYAIEVTDLKKFYGKLKAVNGVTFKIKRGEVFAFPTYTTRLSQVCHKCGTISKKPLSQRWHECECGIVAQRDLYSAFLAMCVEGEQLNAGYAQAAWPGVDTRLQAELSNAQHRAQPANGQIAPSSFGLNSQRQNRSPGNLV